MGSQRRLVVLLLGLAVRPAAPEATADTYREYTVPVGGGAKPLRLLSDAHVAGTPLVQAGRAEGGGVVLDSAAGCEPGEGGDCSSARVAQTGRVVWPSAVLLLHTLQLHVPEHGWAGAHILELGSGTGVVGLALARWGAESVMLTDLPHMIPIIERHIEANGVSSVATAAVLDWESPEQGLASVERSFDAIVGGDVIYSKAAVKPYLRTLRAAFGAGSGSTPGVAFVAMHERGKGFLARYFRVHARKAGFAVEVLNSTLAAESISESLRDGDVATETEREDIELFRHTARMAVTAIGTGDLYCVRIRLPASDAGGAASTAESWTRDADMWTDLMELIQMKGGGVNPHAVQAVGATEPEVVGSADTRQSEAERREAKIAARREARREAKARHEHWYSHANPGA